MQHNEIQPIAGAVAAFILSILLERFPLLAERWRNLQPLTKRIAVDVAAVLFGLLPVAYDLAAGRIELAPATGYQIAANVGAALLAFAVAHYKYKPPSADQPGQLSLDIDNDELIAAIVDALDIRPAAAAANAADAVIEPAGADD